MVQFRMALLAVSASANSQKPNPLGLPVSRSNISLQIMKEMIHWIRYLKLTTGPTSLKMSMICSSVISKGMFPTKTTRDMEYVVIDAVDEKQAGAVSATFPCRRSSF